MMIVIYGQWIAMSVVEEKSSRVMEVVLNAATPFELLSGKVLGVGAVAFTQYAALLLAGGAAVLAQGTVAGLVLGNGADVTLPQGLTIELLLVFGVYGVLGFLLFAVLYAAAASLVSRQEDVNAIVMPMTLIATGGYLVAVYSATGLIDVRSDVMAVLAQVPLVSPFMMLSRITSGQAVAWEVALSIVLLVVADRGRPVARGPHLPGRGPPVWPAPERPRRVATGQVRRLIGQGVTGGHEPALIAQRTPICPSK